MISQKFKKIKVLALLAGPGSGSKVFQSFIDGHPQVLMIPGYILMYFYPHWKKHLKNHNNWTKIINHFLKLHPSIIDAKNLKGGDYLFNLGLNKKQSVKINKKKFIKKLKYYLKGEEINSKNFFLAIHLAYEYCLGKNLKAKKILFYHMHVCWYIKYLYNDFQDTKTITMIRELKSNIPNRIPSFEKPNEMHLNKTDAIFFKTRSYKNTIFEDFFSLDYLKRFQNKDHRVIRHEDLLIKKKEILENFCKFVGISFKNTLLKSTINNYIWNYKFNKNTTLKNGVASHIVDYDKKNFFNYEIFWINSLSKNFNKHYSYKNQILSFSIFNKILSLFFIILPSKKELSLLFNFFTFKFIKIYFESLYEEAFKIKLKQYEKNAFYSHKWSNKNFPFKFINFLISKINKKKNIFWIIVYILLKILMFIFIPAVIVYEYIFRIMICFRVYFRDIRGLRFFPKKI